MDCSYAVSEKQYLIHGICRNGVELSSLVFMFPSTATVLKIKRMLAAGGRAILIFMANQI